MLFLYLTCSCSIGLVSLTVLFLAYLKSWWKGLIFIGGFLLTGTVQLFFLTYVAYRYANIPTWFNSRYFVMNYGLESLTVFLAPAMFNELLKVEPRRPINYGFGFLAIGGLACAFAPFFPGVVKDGTPIDSLIIYQIFRFIFTGSFLYVFIMTCINVKNANDVGERNFYLSAAGILLILASQTIAPVIKTFPENTAVLATGYFFLNALLLKFLVNRYVEFSKPVAQNTLDDLVTNREKEVLALLAQGLPNKDIAATLCITETTVKSHIKNIYKKLGVNNRVQLFNKLRSNPGSNLPGDAEHVGEAFKKLGNDRLHEFTDFSVDDQKK